MEKEPRKASEVLLALESKIDILMHIVRTQDLNIKILSNKINALTEKTESVAPQAPTFRVAAVDTTVADIKHVSVSPESALPSEPEPKGFRRTSRPETYSGDNAYLKAPSLTKFPTQIPKLKEAEIVIPTNINTSPNANTFREVLPPEPKPVEKPIATPHQNTVPIVQRIVDKNGKSVFLADVEIVESQTKQTVSKLRTNGAGKWMASLPVGQYKVFIRKRESVNKEKLEVIQDIQVDGSKSPLELQTVIIKA